ncbi:glycosyltransferase family 4 protein [Providencia manganoxydans]|uniref:glycosyltransferase family 4 protein n=1 Tax=Providencia manganoxydans TaxID=2923283 RepID=UPI0032DB1878
MIEKNKKSILITSNAYYPNVGGIENSLYHLAHVFNQKGYNVDIVISNIDNSFPKNKLAPSEKIDDINIHRYNVVYKLPFFLKPFSVFLSFISLYKTLKKVKKISAPEITISRFHTTTIFSKLVGLKKIIYLVPGVVKYQNHPNKLSNKHGLSKVKQYISYYYHVYLQSKAFQYADKLAVFSQNMKTQVLECISPKKDILLVKPGVDLKKFYPISDNKKFTLRKKNLIPEDKIILLGIGRFVKAKGFIYILEALKYLDNYHLVLVGSGEEEYTYKKFIEDNKLQEKVTFTGAQQNPVEYYQLSDFFIMSSIYEPLGQTILEALSCSLPIVAFHANETGVTTATSEILRDDEVIYVKKLSGYAISEIISSYSHMNLSNIKSKARNIAQERFSWERLAENLQSYESK